LQELEDSVSDDRDEDLSVASTPSPEISGPLPGDLLTEFRSVGVKYRAAHYDVYPVHAPKEFGRSLDAFKQVFGEEVLIDGERHRIVGLEATCLGAPISEGELFGIAVNRKVEE
jgi:hypothetical protein